ncbi:MAG: endonuclease/exonuclease/phosphatase family protein [Gammaproteobacteria bacterium]|nr:endonuclease/exonuclease/phosphatase family protein [Gammaproteobacteria bacterium]
MTMARLLRVADGLLTLALLGLGAATVLAAGARLGWVMELATHFRPQYAVLLVAAGAVACARGRWKVAVTALALAVPNLWVSWPYLAPWFAAGVDSPTEPPAVVVLNLHYISTDYERVRRYLDDVHPDVLVLAELTPAWHHALQPVLERYPHRIAASRHSPWGLGLYSRYPLVEPRGTDLGVRGSFNVVATVVWPEGPVRLVAAHLASPTRPQFAAARNRQLQDLAALFAAMEPGQPRLLVGDLNITPFSPYLRDFLARTGMRDARQAQGWHGTWPRWLLPLQIPIDHAIVDASLAPTRVARGPDVGSDHYPLEVWLQRSEPEIFGGDHGK